MSFQRKSLIIGIAGDRGAGKTSIANSISKLMGNGYVVVIKYDSYYRDRSNLPPEEQDKVNFDHPNELDMDRLANDLRDLLAGREVMIPCYDFTTHCRKEKGMGIKHAEIIIIEGILIFTHERLRELMDLKIFLDVDNDIRLIRSLKRDIQQRGRTLNSVIDQYMKTVRPMHQKFVESAKQYADVIITNWDNQDAVEMVISLISGLKYTAGLQPQAIGETACGLTYQEDHEE